MSWCSRLFEETLAQGFGVLAEEPGTEVVFGTYCQPGHQEVEFRPLPPEEFAAFDRGPARYAAGISLTWVLPLLRHARGMKPYARTSFLIRMRLPERRSAG